MNATTCRSGLIRRSVAAALILLCHVSAEGQPSRAEAIRKDITLILAQPRYVLELRKGRALETIGDWILDVLRALADLFERLVRGAGVRDAGTARVLSWVIIVSIVAGVALLLGRSVWVYRRKRSRNTARVDPKGRVERISERSGSSSQQLLAQASAAADRGDWNAAFRLAFCGLMLVLHERQIVAYDPALTTGEYLRRLQKVADVYAGVRPLARRFDRVVYGNSQADSADYSRCLSVITQFPQVASTAIRERATAVTQ